MKRKSPTLCSIVLLGFTTQVLISCCGMSPCESPILRLSLRGFTPDEADTLMVKRYDRERGTVTDSMLVDKFTASYYQNRVDSTITSVTLLDTFLRPAFNYEITVAALGSKYYITNFNEIILEEKRCFIDFGKGCWNDVTYRVNGVESNQNDISLIK